MEMEGMNPVRRWMKPLSERLKKYRLVLMVLLAGVLLMMLPIKRSQPAVSVQEPEEPEQAEAMEQRLEELLRQVDGAGETQVMLTLHKGIGYEYLSDTVTEVRADGQKTETEMVFASGSGGDEPILTGMTYPVYQGAVVVCDGADRPSVRLAVIDAVSSLTGLRSTQIAVIKMRSN